MSRRDVRAFSLIELLVVVSIVSMLVAMLLPALQKARDASQKISCASQLRQNALILFMYADASEDWFPQSIWYSLPNVARDPKWVTDYYPGNSYFQMLRCPSAKEAISNSGFYTPVQISETAISTSYNFWVGTGNYTGTTNNMWFDWQGFEVGSTQARPDSPVARRTFHGRHITWHKNGYKRWVAEFANQPMLLDLNNPTTGIGGTTAIKYRNNHADGQNTLYADGHSRYQPSAEVIQRYRTIYY